MQRLQTANRNFGANNAKLGWRERMAIKQLGRLQIGVLHLTLPNGESIVFDGKQTGPEAALVMHSPHLVNRLLASGASGFAQGYIHGDWDSPNLTALLDLLYRNEQALAADASWLQGLHTSLLGIRHRLRRNTKRGSRRNIAFHYDLGNEFYKLWLDETWTYSGAVFATPDEELAVAQRRKYQRLLERIAPSPDDHVLEIGCGWGGFAIHAARATGCRVTGITLSHEQLRFARQRAQDAGLTDRVNFELLDYRDIRVRYDYVVSIEMYEAVGEAYWPAYFKALRGALKPGGRAAIQAITIAEASFPAYRKKVDFIQEYIFPGGMLASPSVFERCAAAQSLRPTNRVFYGLDYLRTLQHWEEAVVSAQPQIVAMQGLPFYRMWRYYLAYCAAGFHSNNIDLMHVTLTRD